MDAESVPASTISSAVDGGNSPERGPHWTRSYDRLSHAGRDQLYIMWCVKEHWTPLHEAAADSDESLVQSLVASGANIAAKSTGGLTPLPYVAHMGDTTVAALVEMNGQMLMIRRLAGGRPWIMFPKGCVQWITQVFGIVGFGGCWWSLGWRWC